VADGGGHVHVREEENPEHANDGVEGFRGGVERFNVGVAKFGVGKAAMLGLLARKMEEILSKVDADDAAISTDGFGGRQRGCPRTAADIENMSASAERGFFHAAAADAVPEG